MKKIKNILLPISLVAIFSMTSCNNGLARVSYKNAIEREAAQTQLDEIREKQLPDDEFTLFNAGTVSYKYSISITGDIRLDKSYTLDNINLHTNGYVNFAWDLEHNYFKTDGPKEIVHIFKDENGKWWKANDYQRGVARKKIKYNFDEDEAFISYGKNFTNYIVAHEAIYDLSTGVYIEIPVVSIPFGIIYASGLTGYADKSAEYLEERVLTPHKIFNSEEYNEFFDALHEEYDGNNKNGHYIEEKYANDDNGSLSCAVKGDIDLSLYDKWYGRWYLSGNAFFDTFTAWEKNFIRQSIFHLNAHVIESQINAWNLTFKVDVEEDVKEGCKIEKVNLDEYVDPED